ncbi:MAG: aminopeptidase P N-terminal domain-containing protein [Gemmatimonadales bacterium]
MIDRSTLLKTGRTAALLAVGGWYFCAVPQALDGQVKPAGSTEQRFFDWTDMQFPATEYLRRRSTTMEMLHNLGGGVLLIPSAHGVSNGETFRQLDDFLYFTGLELPRSMLAIDGDSGRMLLFTPEWDARFENSARRNDFPGRPLATDPAISARSGIRTVLPFEQLDTYLDRLVNRHVPIWVDRGTPGRLERIQTQAMPSWTAADRLVLHLQRIYPDINLSNAYTLVARNRMIKSPAEITVMRRSAEITARAVLTAAQSVVDGIDERGLEAVFEAQCKSDGSERVAFASIIKSGPNSLWPWRILASHYNRRNRAMHNGELVIFDVGCELHHYASDMGRTFPVSGWFSDIQRQILRMITTASDSVLAAVRPGLTLSDLSAVGIAQIPSDQRKYMPTEIYFGHHIGLSTGDPALRDVPLAPGMVFTVEPWYYNHDLDISVFIEDEVLVTEEGAEVLTRSLPRSPEELEMIVRRSHK